jgi:rubrerythrin
MQYVGYIVGIVLVIAVVEILIYAFSRNRKKLPKHSSQQQYPRPGPPPEDINLTPKQPPVQQIVIKEVVKVKCRYCGALIDSTAQVCPECGAPRT